MPTGDRRFGPRLRRLRHTRSLTQKDLAGSEYSDAYISALEAGRRRPSGEAVTYLAGRLGVEPEELLTGRPSGLPIRLDLDIKSARKLMSAGQLDEARSVLGGVIRQARRYRLVRVDAAALEALGRCAILEGQPEGGLECYERAIGLLAREPLTARVGALAGKARCLRMLGDLHHSVFVLEQALDELRREQLPDAGALLRLHASLVPSYFQLGAYGLASASAVEALRLAPHSEEPELVADMHMNVARVMLAQGKVAEAMQSLERARELFGEMELRTEIAHCGLALGYVLAREGRLDEAWTQLTRAEEIFVATGNHVDEARVKNELGRVAFARGNRTTAHTLLSTAIRLLSDQGDVAELAIAHRELGLVEAATDARAAQKHLREAIDLFRRSGADIELAITYRHLGDVLAAQGNGSEAVDAFRAGLLAIEETAYRSGRESPARGEPARRAAEPTIF